MGFRFSIEHANWLAHILQPSGATPRLADEYEEQETLRSFLSSFRENFYPSRPASGRMWHRLNDGLLLHSDEPSYLRREILELRNYFSNVPWVALLLPSGTDSRSDSILTDAGMLRSIVADHPDEPGLILQLEEPPGETIALQDVFPALKTALAEFTRWPGILIWNASDSIFLELTHSPIEIQDRLNWLFRRLHQSLDAPRLEVVKYEYGKKFGSKSDSRRFHILHMSDLHLGSKLARRRMPRVEGIIRSVIAELGDEESILPIVTGDLMDTPSDENLADVRGFINFLRGLGGEEPVVTIGNHDVRQDGWLNPKFRQAVSIAGSPVVWFDEAQLVLACFNSAIGGHLARGWIGSDEMADVGNALDQHPEKAAYTLFAALHHHPLPVQRPDWYRRSWYERILGDQFEATEELEDAPAFLRWLEVRNASAVLHGHKHIPRFDRHNHIAVIGCGSSIGKVDTVDAMQTFMSVNLITIDKARNLLSCRLRAERVPGAGLENVGSHEIVMNSRLHATALPPKRTTRRTAPRTGRA